MKLFFIDKTPFISYKEVPKSQLKEEFQKRLSCILSSSYFKPNEARIERKNKLMWELDKILKDKNAKINEKIIKEYFPVQTWLNNPILRNKTKKVENINSVKNYWKILYTAMKLYDGIWLATPQIWLDFKMIAVCQLSNDKNEIISSEIMINPEIIEKSKETICNEESCLSLPWISWKVKRSNKIKVKYQTLEWEEKILETIWFNAAIIQHEIDHLNWILFFDRIKKTRNKS